MKQIDLSCALSSCPECVYEANDTYWWENAIIVVFLVLLFGGLFYIFNSLEKPKPQKKDDKQRAQPRPI